MFAGTAPASWLPFYCGCQEQVSAKLATLEPAIEKAGLRRFRFHDLRHTFGSLLIQGGALLTYVKEQMAHSSIQITVDTCGHLIPGAEIAWVDRLDSTTTPQPNATQAKPVENESEREDLEVTEKIWLPSISLPSNTFLENLDRARSLSQLIASIRNDLPRLEDSNRFAVSVIGKDAALLEKPSKHAAVNRHKVFER